MSDDQPTDRPTDAPDFGPSGYLPERASKRARKIVLRAPMGMHWIWGAVAVGVGVVVVGVIFLLTAGGPPGEPFVELGPRAALQDGHFEGPSGDDAYLATTSGRLRIFAVDDPTLAWCEPARQFEADGGVWTATGRGRGGVDSLAEHPTVIVDDVVYWDPTRTVEGPLADPMDVPRGC